MSKIYRGTTEVKPRLGTSVLNKVFRGATQVWANWTFQTGTYINWSPVTNRAGFSPGPDARLALNPPVRPQRLTGTVVNSQCDWDANTTVFVQLSYDNQATWQTVYSRTVYLNPPSGCTSSSASFNVTVNTEALATHVRVFAPNRHNNVTHNVRITEWYTQ